MMKAARFSVRRLMKVVALAALNLAVARALASYNDDLMVGVMPAALVLQAALVRLARTRGRSRAFWAGFLTGGGLTLVSFVLACEFSATARASVNPLTGRTTFVAVPGSYGGDQMYAAWSGYARRVDQNLPFLTESQAGIAAVFFLPQVLAALASGLLAWRVAWMSG